MNQLTQLEAVTIGNATLILGDAHDILPLLAPESIDSLVTDPPYGIEFMGKQWDSDIPNACLWGLAIKLLKPGAHLLSFSSARTYHRLASQIEKGGFDIRDQIMWIYGSGMPKSHSVAKAVQAFKTTGSAAPLGQRKAAMGDTYCLTDGAGKPGYGRGGNFFGPLAHQNKCPTPDLAINDNAAGQWAGWGTGLKPAHEPICMARKPFRGSCTANVLKHATGALNIDECRVAGNDNGSVERRKGSISHLSTRAASESEAEGRFVSRQSPAAYRAERKGEALGRWPANVIHDGSEEILAQFPQVRTGKGTKNARKRNNIYTGNFGGKVATSELNPNGGDNGSAARFFYCAKASTKDREEGLEFFSKKDSCFLQTGGTSGKPPPSGHMNAPRANLHPTVKPTRLMAYLCRLVTPRGGVILDCFMGSGSTGKAAVQEGFRFVGIERDPEHFRVACARIAYAQGIAFDPAMTKAGLDGIDGS